jgi:hypothetical protein
MFHAYLSVRTMVMAWEPVSRGHLQVQRITLEAIMYQEYGYCVYFKYCIYIELPCLNSINMIKYQGG